MPCAPILLSGPAYERIAASSLKELIVTDSIPLRADVDTSKITVFPCTTCLPKCFSA